MAKKVNIQELSRRYTTAVFELAKANGELDKVSKELATVTDMLAAEPKLQKVLNSPLLSAAQQVELVREIAKSAKVSPITTNFLLIIARNRRVVFLTQIIKTFRERIAEENNELHAVVTTAQKLTAAQIKQLETELGAKTGKKIIVEENVDTSIIGGLVVKIGSRMIDYSVRARLRKLKNEMVAAS